jgi:hypothetical protein
MTSVGGNQSGIRGSREPATAVKASEPTLNEGDADRIAMHHAPSAGHGDRTPCVLDDASHERDIGPARDAVRREVRRSDDALRILVMCNYDPYNAATVCDHINGFHYYSAHQVFVLSNVGELPADFSFAPFDVVVVHYSLFLAVDAYVPPSVRGRLSAFRGLKLLFIQDEYRFVNKTHDAIKECGIDVVFTCVPQGEIPKVYPPEKFPRTSFINVLTGYVPEGLKLFQPRPLADRPFMVGYRGRVYPAWHGEAGREKHEIGRKFLADAKRYNLKCDIAWDEKSRLYGLEWVRFMQNCRAILAVESGASVFDFDGTVSASVETFASVLGLFGKQSRRNRRLLSEQNPYYKDPESRELYEVIRDAFFREKENLIDLSQLSPRVFEAATLRTLLIMYEGQYSGAFKPWQHYVPLRKDHSNMNEVVEFLHDPIECAKMIARTYAEVCENEDYSYRKFISRFDEIVATLSVPERRSEVPEFTRDQMDAVRKFYFIQYPYSLPNPKSRLPRNPIRLLRQLVFPRPGELGLRDILVRNTLGRLRRLG